MKVHVFRHGIAIDRGHPDCPPEAERFLTERGIKRTRAAAKGLRALELGIDAIWTSPYLRARQTAEIAAKVLGFKGDLHVTEALLPEADPEVLWREVADADASAILCAGHAPHVDRFIAHGLDAPRAPTRMKKAGLASLSSTDLGQWVLLSLLDPGHLRAICGRR